MRFLTLITPPAAILIIAAGCATSRPFGSDPAAASMAARAQSAGLSTEEIQSSSHLYNLKCIRCHKFYDPADYSADDWDIWMNKMSKKAKLTPEQNEALSRYLQAARQEKRTAS